MMAMNGFPVTGLVRRCGSLTFLLFILAALICPGPAKADTNSLALINLTGGITAYTGTGIKIGQVEGPGVPDTNNVYIQGPVMLTTNLVSGTAGTAAAHSTEVAGVLIGVSNNVPGVAPGASLYSVEDPSAYGPASQTNTTAAAWWLATNQNVNVINLSDRTSDPGTNTLGADYASLSLDRLVSQTRVSFVKSAGNSGPLMNTITEPGGAYNIITVGAVTNLPGATGVADFSSRGYLSNGRSALDILAPGVNVTMPTTPVGPGNNALTNVTDVPGVETTDGTSFAAPHVTGVIARMLQVAQSNSGVFTNPATSSQAQDPRVVKALLLNSATKLSGWNQQGTVTNGGVITVNHPLDPNQGSGLLNAAGAYAQLTAGQYDPTVKPGITLIATNSAVPLTGWDSDNVGPTLSQGGLRIGTTNEYHLGQMAAGQATLTLDWNRDVDTAANNFNALGLANLDLSLFSSPNDAFTNLTLVAQSISSVDNLQHLWLTNLAAAYYEVDVSFSNYDLTSGSAPPNTTYAVAWAFTVPEPSSLLLAALGVTSLCLGLQRRRRP